MRSSEEPSSSTATDKAVEWTLNELYDKQEAAFFSIARLIYTDGSTKSGKTVGGLQWQFCQCWGDGAGKAHLWVAPVYPQAKMAFDRVCRFLTKGEPTKKLWDANKTELLVTFSNGSRWYFKGSDNSDSIYGPDYSSVVMDEVTRCKEEAWAAVRSTTTKTKGPIRMIGNVKGRKNWAYKLAERIRQGTVPSAQYHKITAIDAVAAGKLDQEDIDNARAELPEHVFKELYLCEPSEDGANPFGMAAIAKCVGELSKEPTVAFGIDLAKSQDWTVVHGFDASGRTSFFQRWHGLDWNLTQAKIAAIVGGTPAYCDSSGVGDPVVDGLKRDCPLLEGFPTGAGTRKQQLMEGLAVAIQQGKVVYPDASKDCPIRQELESFEYTLTAKALKVSYAAAEGLHDDCVIALGLAYAMLDKVTYCSATADVVAADVFGGVDSDDRFWQ